MEGPSLSDVTQVQETSSVKEANKFLNQGWMLINTYRASVSYESDDEACIYVLGKIIRK